MNFEEWNILHQWQTFLLMTTSNLLKPGIQKLRILFIGVRITIPRVSLFEIFYLSETGMDWLCPGYNQVLANQLNTLHGSITAEVTISDILPIVQTGDLHVAIYDHQNENLYVANARGDGEEGPSMAYDRYILIS